MTKGELRREIAARLAALDPRDAALRSGRILRRVLELPELLRASKVFTFVSRADEVDTLDLIRELLSSGKDVAVPRVIGPGIMEAHRIGGIGDLEPGPFGILGPRMENLLPGTPDVSICPGVAFTHGGDRLGRGGGFYDRFLAENGGTFAVGICFELQIVDAIPLSGTDRRLHAVVTEDRVIRI